MVTKTMVMMAAQRSVPFVTGILFIFVCVSPQIDCFNNQVQLVRKLSPLRSYKDAQFFRFRIPPEVNEAIIVLNASQSDTPINSTIGGRDSTVSGEQGTGNVAAAAAILSRYGTIPAGEPGGPPFVAINQSSSFWPPPWINTTLITVYGQKVHRFYQSVLSTACKKPLDVKFYIRWGSLPLLAIRNGTNPDNFVFKNDTDQYQADLRTDGRMVVMNITNPMPGDWYGMAFINKTSDKISQKGLERECFYRFHSNLTLHRNHKPIIQLIPSYGSSQQKQSLIIDHRQPKPELLYKFYLGLQEYGAKIIITNCRWRPSNSGPGTNIRHSQGSYPMMIMGGGDPMLPIGGDASGINNHSVSSSSSSNQTICPIELNFRSLTLPSSKQNEFSFNCHTNNSNVEVINQSGSGIRCVIDLPAYTPHRWNYLQIIPSGLIGTNNQSMAIPMPIMFGEPGRNKYLHGSINFTIQLLAGQEAFLYNYFNDQNCQQQQQQQQQQQSSSQSGATTSSPSSILGSGFHFGPNNLYDNMATTATSNLVVDAPKVNQISPGGSINVVVPATVAAINPPAANKNKNKMANVAEIPPSVLKPEKADFDTLEFDGDDQESEFGLDNNQKFSKRSADAQRQDRQKNNKKKEERRLKKQRNKNRQKNREKAALRECQFDPAKIIGTLDEDELTNITTYNIYDLTRYQAGENFEFRYSYYDIVENRNSSNEPVYLEIENDRVSLMNFTVIPQFDIGGSLSIEFAISPWTNVSYQNLTAILCLTHEKLPPIFVSASGIRLDQYCYGTLISNTSNANFTAQGSVIQSLVIPYPQPGIWYLAIMIRCYQDGDPEDPGSMAANSADFSCDYSNRTSIMIDIRSSACVNSRCQNNGKCQQYLNAGILYSTCSCRAGWKGWICNDGSEALSQQRLLINFLLLTVSNAAFLPAIILAACRRYFTESAIYFLTMISSALYHACDSDFSQSYCVLSISLLQFADFYTAILSFFVTLLTLAYLSPACKSFLHLLGAILIALITQNDRTNLWTFVIPAGLGTILLFICWCSRCCRKSCYPPARCWIFSFCPALILTIAGLIIYAFFETQENYAVTHSIWHIVVALALFLAIPSMPPHNSHETDDDDDEHVHFMSSSGSSGGPIGTGSGSGGAGSGKGTQNAKSAHVEWRPPHTSFKFLHDDIDML